MTTESENKRTVSPFPRGVQFTPVPNPMLAGLLGEISDISELKVTLRVIWALHRKKSPLAYVTAAELSADRAVAAMLGATGDELNRAVETALRLAVERGTLLALDTGKGAETRYLLNTEPIRTGLVRQGFESPQLAESGHGYGFETQQSEPRRELHQGVFKVYEENIGAMSPLIAESISEALQEHPESDVIDAIRVAMEANARSWKYVTAVLRRWAVEGRDTKEARGSDGKPERYSEANRSDEFIERYLDRQRARGNR